MKRRIFIKRSATGTLILMSSPATFANAVSERQSTPLEEIFLNPPDEAKAKTWWHWMNGNVTKEGITLDMEAMKQAGVGGFQIFDVGSGIVEGPVKYHSDEWLEMKQYAAREAERIGLVYEMHNCPGWSSSGGPWITPGLSMQCLVWSETYVSGGKNINIKLARPMAILDYYRDAMVLAFPSLKEEEKSMTERLRNIISNQGDVSGSLVTDGDLTTGVDVNLPESGGPAFLSLEFSEPVEARSLIFYSSWLDGQSSRPGQQNTDRFVSLEVSDDGMNYRKICDFNIVGHIYRARHVAPSLADFVPVRAKYYRVVSSDSGFRVNHIQLTSGRIADWNYKSNMNTKGSPGGSAEEKNKKTGEIFPGAIIDPETVIDISGYMDGKGQLNWDAPVGNWTVIRFGHTSTGVTNNAAPSNGEGLECDKFSKEAYAFHFNQMFEKLLPSLERLSEKGMTGALVDSYEVGPQNWTTAFPRLFKEYRGYDILKYMPAMTGRVVGSVDVTERFLFDIRKTCSDLIADNYYGYFTELCKAKGMVSYTEPYDKGPFEEMQIGSRVDIPMGEFWIRGGIWDGCRTIKLAASVAHANKANGRQIVGAESFTGRATNSKWLECPYMMKALGDWMYTSGLNQFIFHRFAHQPHPSAKPGMTMGPWGFHFDRTNTWFPKGKGWLNYIARCQNMLRNGLFVADIAYFTGEEQPNRNPDKDELTLQLPKGYDYDIVNTETILERMKVEKGRIVLDNGMSYKVLVLSAEPVMTLKLLTKISDMVRQGACIIGPKPVSSPSLESHLNNRDGELKNIAESVWGGIDGVDVTKNTYGDGNVYWGQSLKTVLDKLGVKPDFESTAKNPDPVVSYVHRRINGEDVYFVANRRRRTEELVCTFRVDGKVPELWDAVTGRMSPAGVYELADGGVRMPLQLDFTGSVFVVFREQAPAKQIHTVLKGSEVVVGTQPFPVQEKGLYRNVNNNFTLRLWVKPEIDLTLPGTGGGGPAGPDTNFAIYPPEGEILYGPGHTTCGLTAGRNGIIIYENRNGVPDPVLVEQMPLAGWTHIGITYQDGTPSLYVNGRFVSKGQRSGSIVHPAISEAYMDEGAGLFEGDVTIPELSVDPFEVEQLHRHLAAGLPAPEEAPAIELNGAANHTGILFWQEGSYTLRDNTGNNMKVDVTGLGTPVEISGPWTVRFPDGLGAPSETTLDTLTSLHRHSDEGVRYFSGTASYRNTFNVASAMTDNGKRLFLDLGRVEVLAEVKLNGKEVGLFWKPPYRIDVTDFVQTGDNELEVAVTNLWPNRLIGDEQLPVENDYGSAGFGSSGGISKMPDWFLNGREKPGKRITFSTWQHYKEEDPLLESGLLGPVKLRTAYVPDIIS